MTFRFIPIPVLNKSTECQLISLHEETEGNYLSNLK